MGLVGPITLRPKTDARVISAQRFLTPRGPIAAATVPRQLRRNNSQLRGRPAGARLHGPGVGTFCSVRELAFRVLHKVSLKV